MTHSSSRVLFVGHDGSRTGAAIVLLHLLEWIKANTNFYFEVIIRNGGELEADYRQIAPVYVLDRARPTGEVLTGVTRTLRLKPYVDRLYFYALKKRLEKNSFDLIYSNTATNGETLSWLSGTGCRVLSHIHELEYWIAHRLGANRFNQVKQHTDHYIAVSEAVKSNLVFNHKIEKEQIDVVHEFIPTESFRRDSRMAGREGIRRSLGIPQDAPVVGASGTIDWHKGADLFVQLARLVNKRIPESRAYFVWVGGDNSGLQFDQLQYDIKSAGLQELVKFLGAQPDPADYFSVFDVFALTSRVDSFPLVNLEAAALGKPLVCFDGSGGAKEFVEDDCGFVVPYLDIEEMANRVVALLQSSRLAQQFGERAAQKVRERHDVSIAAPRIAELIERECRKHRS